MTTEPQADTNGTTPADAPTTEPAADAGGTLLDGDAQQPEGTLLDGDAPADEKPAAEGAPEQYEEFKTEEGFKLNDDAMEEFKAVAKGSNLSQENAQKFLDLATKHTQTLMNAQRQQFAETRNAWKEELKQDREFGGPNMKDTVNRAVRALGKFGSPELKTLLSNTGMGDNHEVIKLLARVDKETTGEDQTLVGGGPAEIKNIPDHELFYNNTAQSK